MFQSFQRGESLGLHYYFEKYGDGLYRFCVTFLKRKDLAEDVKVESFIVAWNHRLDIVNEAALKSYLYQTAINKCLQHLQSRKNELAPLEALSRFQEEEERSIAEEARLERLSKLVEDVEKLPPQRKLILKLRYWGNKSVKTIAEVLNLHEQTVRNQLAKAKTTLGRKKKPPKQ